MKHDISPSFISDITINQLFVLLIKLWIAHLLLALLLGFGALIILAIVGG